MARTRSLTGDVDLRAFYSAGMMVRQGHADQLYSAAQVMLTQQQLFLHHGRVLPFLYPAFASLPFVPLTWFSYSAVFCFTVLMNLALLYASAHLLCVSTLSKVISPGWLFALFVCFFPTAIALMQGQISCALLFAFVVAHVLEGRGQMFLVGLCLSLTLAKPQLALPVMLLYVLGRQWRILAGFLVGGVGMLSLSLWVTGLQGARAYLACLRGLSSTMTLAPAMAKLQFGMQAAAEPNLHGWITAVAGAGNVSMALVVVASICTLTLATRRVPAVATALPAALLVSYHLQPYDLLLLLLPLVVLYATPQPRSVSLLSRVSVLLLVVPVAPYLLVHEMTVWLVLAVLGIAAACALQRGCIEFLPNSFGQTRWPRSLQVRGSLSRN